MHEPEVLSKEWAEQEARDFYSRPPGTRTLEKLAEAIRRAQIATLDAAAEIAASEFVNPGRGDLRFTPRDMKLRIAARLRERAEGLE